MKFFGCIAHHYPREIFEKYPAMIDFLFDTFEHRDQTIFPVALDTLGFIGCTIEGKLCLAAVGNYIFLYNLFFLPVSHYVGLEQHVFSCCDKDSANTFCDQPPA
jgi:hypothetical protein